MEAVQELEHYLSKNTIDTFVREMMVRCLKEKPEEPISFLLKFILDKNANKASEEVAVASSTSAPESKGGAQPAAQAESYTHVAVCSSERQIQQYLTDKKVHVIFLELLKQVIQEQPDNPLSFIALQAHNLHKAPPTSLTQ